ncbi:MAG: hypothetical protein QNJ65_11875 [Xenococcaceae cyanobacterium MO_234.B1]|nr:hypothetical protein [Xenococcaceae cyanobacterium MO_234.B1]
MSELVCEALATKAELQELRDQINQLLGQPDEEEGEPINVLAAGTLAGTAILGGQLVDIDVVKQGNKVVELRKVARSGKVVKLKGLTQVVTNNAAKSTAVTKAAAVTGASLAGIFSVLSTLLSIFITTKQNELNGLILSNMEREATLRDLDYERLIKIAGKQQENLEVANNRITEMNQEIAEAKITNEQLNNDLERASEYIEQLREGLGEQADWIEEALEYIDDLKLDFKEFEAETTEDITNLQTTVDDLEIKLEESFTYQDTLTETIEKISAQTTSYQAQITELTDRFTKQEIASSVQIAELINLRIAYENEFESIDTQFQSLDGELATLARRAARTGGSTSVATRNPISNQQNKTLELMNTLAGNPITDLPTIQPYEFDNVDNPFNDLFSQLLPQITPPDTGTGGDLNVDIDELSTRLNNDFSTTLSNTLTTLGIVGITTTVNDIYNQTSPSNIASTVSNAVENTVCDISSPGKCLSNNITNPLKQGQDLIKQGQDTLRNLLNTALQGADLLQGQAILNTVTNTNNFLKNAWNSTVIDKTLNAANFALSLHNAMMLSNNIAETILDTVSAVLETVGIKDAEGNPIDVADWLTNKITQIVQGIIGAQTFTELSLKLTAANRIYQAGMNILDNVTDLIDTAMDLDEYTGENIAKIGNALRQSGVVPYDAYEQMIEDLDARGRSKWLVKLEQAEDITDNIYSIADSIRDIKEIGQDLKESRTEFKEVLEESKTTLSGAETELEEEIENSPEPTEQDEARG